MPESKVTVRGWTFERDQYGTIRVSKERLVADSILLDETEWDCVVLALWSPGKPGAPEEDSEAEGGSDENF